MPLGRCHCPNSIFCFLGRFRIEIRVRTKNGRVCSGFSFWRNSGGGLIVRVIKKPALDGQASDKKMERMMGL